LSLGNGPAVVVEESLFENNHSNFSRGGAIGSFFVPLNIDSSTFRGNTVSDTSAAGLGGAIASSSLLTISNSRLENNRAYSGGAIYTDGPDGSTTLIATTLDNNSATDIGGAITFAQDNNLTIARSTLSNNDAIEGGGLAVDATTTSIVDVTNSTFSGNTSFTRGAGLSVLSDGVTSLTSVTIADNESGDGGGIAISNGATVNLTGSIIADNRAPTNPDVQGPLISGGRNIVENRGSSTGYIASDHADGTDPLLNVLADYGGPTFTHALMSGTPANDGGFGIGQDQRGMNASGLRDIGAYERTAPTNVVFSVDSSQSTVVGTAFADDIEVTVVDALGGSLDGETVLLSTGPSPANGIYSSPTTVVSGVDGTATASLQANTIAGDFRANARTPSTSNGFAIMTNLADAPANLTVTGGNNQSTVVGTSFSDSLSVLVEDQFGNIVTDERVDFSVPTTGASGTLSDLFHITGSSGEGHTNVTANTISGDFSVLASVGSLSTTINLTNTADVANQFVLSGHPLAMTAGDTNPFTLTALDQFGNIADGYSGTLVYSTSDAQAVILGNNTLTNGVGSFESDLRTAGIQSFTLLDSVDSSLSATQSNIAVSPDVASNLDIVSGDHQSTVVDTPFANDLRVRVSDRFGNAIAGESINFTMPTTGASASLASIFGVTDAAGLFTSGAQANTISGSYGVQASSGALTASFALENVADAATMLHIGGLSSVAITAGDTTSFSVSALDQFGNIDTNYTETITFSTTDAQAQLPGPTVLTGGIGSFVSEPRTAGTHSLFVTDTALSDVQTGVVVVPAAPSELSLLSGDNQSAVVDTAFSDSLIFRVRDRFNNPIQGASVNLSVPTTEAAASLSSLSFTTDALGIGQVNANANTVSGSYTVLAELGALSTSASLENIADVATQFVLDGYPTAVTAGEVNPFTVTAQDRFGNVADGYGGLIDFSTSDSQAQLPGQSLLTNGVGNFSAELRTAGLQSLSATDSVDTGLTVTQSAISVSPGAPDSLTILDGDNQQTVANTPFDAGLTVQVRDRFGNAVPDESVLFVAPSAGASGTLTSSVATTDALGQASIGLTANELVGVYIVEATTAGLREVFDLTNLSPDVMPASSLETLTDSPLTVIQDNDTDDGQVDFFDEIAFAQLEQSLTEEYAKYWQQPYKKGATLETIQQTLQQAENEYEARSGIVYAMFVPPGEKTDSPYSSILSQRLLNNEVSDSEDELLLMFIPPRGNPIQQRVNVTRQQIQRQATLFNLEVSSFLDNGYQPLARQLYDWLLTPIEDEIQRAGVNDLMYVLDTGLSTVPLPAMMTGDTFAIERYGLSILPSVGLLQTDFGEAPAPQSLLAGGSAEFEVLEALPAVPVELDLVESTATTSQVLLNEDFEIERLRTAQAIAPKAMMHVATHAEFNPGALDRSFIQFWDEQLTLDGLEDMGLQDLELLILSACTTALGSRDAELGFAGLAAATGVEASVGSLWNVSDMGTMALMAEFYEQLRNNPLRSSALRRAQLSLLGGNTRIEEGALLTQAGASDLPNDLVTQPEVTFSHPFFWSGFTLVGNPWW
ncbi:MAG: CHAT domain-containing protein, partial [Cyanobacteria bacterium J06649_4]